MDRLMQHIHDPANAHLFTAESALAAIERSRSSDGRVLRELLESAADLKRYGLVSPEDEALLAGITAFGAFTLEEALARYADLKRLRPPEG